MLEPLEEPGAEPTPTARFAAWVRETVAPELGGPIPAPATPDPPNGAVARDSRVTSWLRGPSAPADETDGRPADTPPAATSRIPAWLRGAPPAEAAEPRSRGRRRRAGGEELAHPGVAARDRAGARATSPPPTAADDTAVEDAAPTTPPRTTRRRATTSRTRRRGHRRRRRPPCG